MKNLRYLLIGTVMLCSACVKNTDEIEARQTMDKAKQEYQQKQYESAAITLMPLVRKGNPEAQYTLGYLYFYGLGVHRNTNYGRQLIQTSAEQGNVKAIEALATFAQQEATLGPSVDKAQLPSVDMPIVEGKPNEINQAILFPPYF